MVQGRTETAPQAKRLIDVAFPLREVSAESAREKSIRHGHISTLHIWWARRPLAACRAVICAALWPDPADENCPQSFRDKASEVLTWFAERTQRDKTLAEGCAEDTFARWTVIAKPEGRLDAGNPDHWNVLRFLLLDFIADFANWDNSTRSEYLTASRELTQAAHEALGGIPGTKPLVVDPFAGGGAIPLEALRVGADAFASDLNPVAVLLNRVALEYVPKHGSQLAEAVRTWGRWVKEQAEKDLSEFYPRDADGAIPIAYIWARTISCEGPGCGAEVPLIKSLWLGRKPHNSWALRVIGNRETRRVEFEIVRGAEPKEVGIGTVRRGSATCPCCGFTTPVKKVRNQLASRQGGANDARLVCVVTTRHGEKGRFYRRPTEQDLQTVARAQQVLEQRRKSHEGAIALTPDEPTPLGGGSGAGRAFSQRNYGMERFENLFTARQLLCLATLAEKVRSAGDQLRASGETELADAVQAVLALNVDKLADYGSSLTSWSSPASQETVRGTFSRQALSITWDFAEAYPFADSSGGWLHNLEYLIGPLENEARSLQVRGSATNASATEHPLPDDAVDALITDPPYYDAIPYADLSDFFVVWLKRSLCKSALGASFTSLAPKAEECVVDEVKGHDHAFFEACMRRALEEGRRITRPGGIGIVVFAHKSTAGWEAQLQALIDAGWVLTGSWPIDTEREGRMRANASAALASSVHLVCRPREDPNGNVRADAIGDWRDVLAELPRRIHEWMPRLAREGIVGADAIFACLGPALEIFSRYSRVEKPSGEQVNLCEYLEHVWAAVAREALSMIFSGADATGFEADARLTAMWLWTASTNGNSIEVAEDEAEDDEDEEAPGKSGKVAGHLLEYDAARKIAQGLGANLAQLPTVVEVKGEKARLLPAMERARHLFGRDGTAGTDGRRQKEPQLNLFGTKEEQKEAGVAVPVADERITFAVGNTVLDRVHQSMLLFASGRGEAMRRFLIEEGAGNDQRFWRLAQALSALYPPQSDEKRWVDGVLARKKGLGF